MANIMLYKGTATEATPCRIYNLNDISDFSTVSPINTLMTGGISGFNMTIGGVYNTRPIIPENDDLFWNALDVGSQYWYSLDRTGGFRVLDYSATIPYRIEYNGTNSSVLGYMLSASTRHQSELCLATAYYNGNRYLGFYIQSEGANRWCFCFNSNPDNMLNVIMREGTFESDPGEKGFRPTGANTSKFKPGNGGRGTAGSKNPAYSGDHIEQPGAPDESSASAVKSGFLNCYKMTQSELNKVCACLYSDTLLDAIKQLMVNPLDFIVSMMIFPCSPDVGASEAIKFGKWSCVATGVIGALGTDMSGAKLSNQFKVFDFGTITVPENWGNFLDYSQTSVELYLPFIGSVQLDPSECMGGTVNVQYTVDFFTGQCVANVYCHKYITLPSGMPIDRVEGQHSYQGNCAVQIPLSAVNYGSMIGSLINACTGSITNPTQPFSVLTDAAGGGFRPSVTSKGNVVANSGFCAVLYPYIRLLRPITAEPESYQEVMGLPSYINTTLGECEDLCVCDGIDLKGISGATESELQRIRQLCSEGVYV